MTNRSAALLRRHRGLGEQPGCQPAGPLVDQKEGEDRGGTDDQTRCPADGCGAPMADHRDDSDRPFCERVTPVMAIRLPRYACKSSSRHPGGHHTLRDPSESVRWNRYNRKLSTEPFGYGHPVLDGLVRHLGLHEGGHIRSDFLGMNVVICPYRHSTHVAYANGRVSSFVPVRTAC